MNIKFLAVFAIRQTGKTGQMHLGSKTMTELIDMTWINDTQVHDILWFCVCLCKCLVQWIPNPDRGLWALSSLSLLCLFVPCRTQGLHHCLPSLLISCCSLNFCPCHFDSFHFCFYCTFLCYPWPTSSSLALGVPVQPLSTTTILIINNRNKFCE